MTESISASTDRVAQQTGHLADQTGRQLARVGGSRGWSVAFGVVTLLAGLLVMVWPGKTVLLLAVVLGIWLIVAGVFRLVAAIAIPEQQGSSRMLVALIGVVAVLAGVLCLSRPLQTVTALALLLGAFWIVAGVIEFFHGVAGDIPGRGWAIAGGLLSMIAGVVVLSYPGPSLVALTWLFGIWLVVLGVLAIVGGFTTTHRSAKAAHHRVPTQPAGPVTR